MHALDRWSWRARTALLVGSATVAAVAGIALAPGPAASSLLVAEGRCTAHWGTGGAGASTFSLTNGGHQTSHVSLVGADGITTYGQLPVLGAGTTRTLAVVLPAGTYAWRCEDDYGIVLSSQRHVFAGSSPQVAHPFVASTYPDLFAAREAYSAQVQRGLQVLAADTDVLQQAVTRDPDRARALWLTAHADYLRLGAAYGTFGDADAAIDGLPAGLPRGVQDPGFTGFHALERELWGVGDPTRASALAADLDVAVHQLASDFAHEQLLATDLPLRAHEILENALQFDLTGERDFGSHSAVADLASEVAATQLVLGDLRPLLTRRAPAVIQATDTALARLTRELARHHGGGGWTPSSALSRLDRERIDGALGQALEQLAVIPTTLEIPHAPGT